MASKRYDENSENPQFGTPASDAHEGKVGFARRALDRGLRASNQLLYRSIFSLLPSFIESVAVLALLCIKAGRNVGLVAAIVSYSFVLLSGWAMNKRLPILRNQLQAEGGANSCAEDALSLAETVAAYGAMSTENNRYSAALRRVSESSLAVRYSFSVLKVMQSVILGLGFTAVTYVSVMAAATDLAIPQRNSDVASKLVLVQALFAQLCAPLDHVGQHLRDCLSAAEDLRELEGLKLMGPADVAANDATQTHHIPEAKTSSHDLLRYFQDFSSSSAGISSPPILEVRDLVFQYRNSALNLQRPTILNHVTLSLPRRGYSIGLVGPSGCGKSSLLRVMVGLENIHGEGESNSNNGSVVVGGLDVTNSERNAIFCMVGQDNDLFGSLSVVDNIRYGIDNIRALSVEEDAAALTAAALDACLGDVIDRLGGGWDASVGPRGRLLSGGERQRVCIARALYRQQVTGGILLLDEATSALDAQTEEKVLASIRRRVTGGACAIMVSHRLSSIEFCDHIMVILGGVVIEQGTHAELLAKDGWYANAWHLQQNSVHRDKLPHNTEVGGVSDQSIGG